jgi:hypothetical protein
VAAVKRFFKRKRFIRKKDKKLEKIFFRWYNKMFFRWPLKRLLRFGKKLINKKLLFKIRRLIQHLFLNLKYFIKLFNFRMELYCYLSLVLDFSMFIRIVIFKVRKHIFSARMFTDFIALRLIQGFKLHVVLNRLIRFTQLNFI